MVFSYRIKWEVPIRKKRETRKKQRLARIREKVRSADVFVF